MWIGLTARDAGVRPSTLIEIESRTLSLDFDLACTNCVLEFENKREIDRLKMSKNMMIEAIGIALGTIKPPEPEDDQEQELSEDDVL